MKYITKTLAGIAFGCCIASLAQAASIQSMTIEEIGLASGGLGSSAIFNGAGEFAIGGGFWLWPPIHIWQQREHGRRNRHGRNPSERRVYSRVYVFQYAS